MGYVEKYLIYPEEALPKRFWPYQKLNIDEVNRRFYALLHETIYEQTKAGIPELKVCDNCIKIVETDKYVIPEPIKTRLGYHIFLVSDSRDRIEKEKVKAPIKPKTAPTGTNIPT